MKIWQVILFLFYLLFIVPILVIYSYVHIKAHFSKKGGLAKAVNGLFFWCLILTIVSLLWSVEAMNNKKENYTNLHRRMKILEDARTR